MQNAEPQAPPCYSLLPPFLSSTEDTGASSKARAAVAISGSKSLHNLAEDSGMSAKAESESTSNHNGKELSHADSPAVRQPPRTLGATLLRLGPGMIIAGSIVGSGELIATTKAGAEAGFWLLWLIIIGCVIKVSTQIEFGRHAITWGQTPLKALNDLPGPRLRVNWLLWYWTMMTMLVISQQGGIVGGVGQALAISRPLTRYGVEYNHVQDELVKVKIEQAVVRTRNPESPDISSLQRRIDTLTTQIEQMKESKDSYLWAAIIAIATSILLYIGRYRLIQVVSTVLVSIFTLLTIITLVMLQAKPEWAVQGHELANGLSFRLPPAGEALTSNPVATALAAFGIIGVGAGKGLCKIHRTTGWYGPMGRAGPGLAASTALRCVAFNGGLHVRNDGFLPAWCGGSMACIPRSGKGGHDTHALRDVRAGLRPVGRRGISPGGFCSIILNVFCCRSRKLSYGCRCAWPVRNYRWLRTGAVEVDADYLCRLAAAGTAVVYRCTCTGENGPGQRYRAGDNAADAGSCGSVFSIPAQ